MASRRSLNKEQIINFLLDDQDDQSNFGSVGADTECEYNSSYSGDSEEVELDQDIGLVLNLSADIVRPSRFDPAPLTITSAVPAAVPTAFPLSVMEGAGTSSAPQLQATPIMKV